MATTTATGLAVPESGDACDVPADMLALGDDLDGVTVPLFASTSARDTAFALTPFRLCVVGASISAGTLYQYRSSAWHVIKDADQLASGTWTNLTLASGFTAAADAPAVRAEGSHAFCRGGINGTFTGSGTKVFDIPSGFTPSSGVTYVWADLLTDAAADGAGNFVKARLSVAGGLVILGGSTTRPTQVRVESIHWPLA